MGKLQGDYETRKEWLDKNMAKKKRKSKSKKSHKKLKKGSAAMKLKMAKLRAMQGIKRPHQN